VRESTFFVHKMGRLVTLFTIFILKSLNFSTFRVLYHDHSYNVHTLAVEVERIVIVNVYKPPSANWPNNQLKVFPHPAIYVGNSIHIISCGATNTIILSAIYS
jgi:hypothetical protein